MSDCTSSAEQTKHASDVHLDELSLQRKIDEYKLKKKLCDEKERERAESMHEVQSMKNELRQLKELIASRSHCTNSEVTAEIDRLLVGAEALPTESQEAAAGIASETVRPTTSNDIFAMMLKAADDAEDLERHQAMLEVLLKQKDLEVEVLTKRLHESKKKKNECKKLLMAAERELSLLNVRLSSLSSSTSSVLQASVHGDDSAPEAIDPEEIRRRIAQLNDRIAQLMKYQTPAEWCEMYQSLQKELEETNRKLDDYQQTFILAEKQRADKAAADRDATIAEKYWLVQHVEELEAKVVELEHQLEMNSDTKVAMEMQLDEYVQEVDTVKREREREIAQRRSVEQQWTTLMEENKKLREQLNETAALLKQTNTDREMVRARLHTSRTSSGHATSGGAAETSPRTDLRSRHNVPPHPPTGFTRRGILEEDSGNSLRA